MFSKECIHCKKFFQCNGKEKDQPCVNLEQRKESEAGGNTQNGDTRKVSILE